MFYSMPINVIPFFVLGVSILLFGLRGLYVYSRQKTPLFFYFGFGATLAGISALLYSVPFVFTQSVEILKITTILGDLFYYATIIIMTRLIWYLGFNKRVAYLAILLPYLIAIVGALVATIIYLPSVNYVFSDNMVHYPVPVVASWFFAAMSSAYIFVGLITLNYTRHIQLASQKTRLYLIGGAFLIGGILATLNFLLFQGSNSNQFGIVGYIVVALVLFIGIFIINRRKNTTS